MTEKDLEIQRLRRENAALREMMLKNKKPCEYCKNNVDNRNRCRKVNYLCDLCTVKHCTCRLCLHYDKWEMRDG